MPNLTLQDGTTVIDLTGATSFESRISPGTREGWISVYVKGIGRRGSLVKYMQLEKAAQAVRDLTQHVIMDGIDVKITETGYVVPDA